MWVLRRLLVAFLAVLAVEVTVATAQTPVRPTGRGDAELPCSTPGRLISANGTSVVSIYSPSQETRQPSRQPGFYACTRGHRFRRLGADPVSQTSGTGDVLFDPALAGRYAGLTTQFCSRAGCFGGVVRSASLTTGRVVSTPFPSDQTTVRTLVTRHGVTIFSAQAFTAADVNEDRRLIGGAVWRLSRTGARTLLAAAETLDPTTLQVDDRHASWLTGGESQTVPVG